MGLAAGAGDRQYTIGTWASLGVYAASILGLSTYGERLHGPALWAASLIPSVAIAAQLVVTYQLLNRLDEYLRALTAKRFIVAAGIAFIVATTWGFLETYAGAMHLPGWLIYPIFWAAFGLVSCFIRSSR